MAEDVRDSGTNDQLEALKELRDVEPAVMGQPGRSKVQKRGMAVDDRSNVRKASR